MTIKKAVLVATLSSLLFGMMWSIYVYAYPPKTTKEPAHVQIQRCYVIILDNSGKILNRYRLLLPDGNFSSFPDTDGRIEFPESILNNHVDVIDDDGKCVKQSVKLTPEISKRFVRITLP